MQQPHWGRAPSAIVSYRSPISFPLPEALALPFPPMDDNPLVELQRSQQTSLSGPAPAEAAGSCFARPFIVPDCSLPSSTSLDLILLCTSLRNLHPLSRDVPLCSVKSTLCVQPPPRRFKGLVPRTGFLFCSHLLQKSCR